MPLSPGFAQRLQLFFPEGVAFDGNRLNRTAVTAPLFKYLAPSESADERVVIQAELEPLVVSRIRARQTPAADPPIGRESGRPNLRPADRAVAASALLRR
jgi:hypothetical protein